MWDWELLKNGSGCHRFDILEKFMNEDFSYSHAISYGSESDEYVMHNHALYEIIFCVSGDVNYIVEGEWYALTGGSMLIIKPIVPHKLVILSDQPFERHTLYASHAANTSVINQLLTNGMKTGAFDRAGGLFISPENTGSLGTYFDSLSRACCQEDGGTSQLPPIFAQAMVAELVLQIKEKHPEYICGGISKTVDKVLLYLSNHFTEKITLATIAEYFHISRDYCNRIFRKATGMSVMQYVIYSRVIFARQLLNEGLSAGEAGRRAGFSDYSSFFRAYKKVTGRSPKEDREIAGDFCSSPSLELAGSQD